PIASQVISDDSKLVKDLPKKIRIFMKPARNMIPKSLLSIVRETCEEFVLCYNEHQMEEMEVLPEKLENDKSWKEGCETLEKMTKGILSVLNDAWDNPAFSPEFVESQNLPFGKSSYVSTAEKQSIAIADRRGEGHFGRRPDCAPNVKKINDSTKLWRETSDGIFWTRKKCYPEKDKFGIIGIQVAGCECTYQGFGRYTQIFSS
ncbi:14932_t:CDS:2, partial [Racocetra persica]